MTYGTMTDQLIALDAVFFADPYPTYARLRGAGPAARGYRPSVGTGMVDHLIR